MPQSADKVIDHEMLFREPEYQELFATKKKEFEFNHSDDRIAEIKDWTKSKEYKDKNFAREALTVNPAKACQPLGAVYVANGFHKTMSFVHGSQGCVAYYRSHFSRHFKEPTSCVSSSMTGSTSSRKRLVRSRRTPQLMSKPTPPGETMAFGSFMSKAATLPIEKP